MLAFANIACSQVVLILPMLDEPPPPSMERIAEIRKIFHSLPRPLQYRVEVEWGGTSGNMYKVLLQRETLRFSKQFSHFELAHALWDYLDDENTEAEACIIITGTLRGLGHGSHFTTFRDAQRPGDWKDNRSHLLAFAKYDCRSVVGAGNNPFWKPHPVLFQYDEKIQGHFPKARRTRGVGRKTARMAA